MRAALLHSAALSRRGPFVSFFLRQGGNMAHRGVQFVIHGLLMSLLLSLLSNTTAWAQATAQINGTVKDQSGAALPGVTITVTQTDTGLTRSVVTDDTGS